MIEITEVSKYFHNIKALEHVTASIGDGQVYGLAGTNGAGKSTLLRTICGIYKPDNGSILADGEEVYENPSIKAQIYYIPDDQYFMSNSTPADMLRFYKTYYPHFDTKSFHKLLNVLELSPERKINTFSKGMKKQISILLGVCSGAKYLLCDETFDGLDPVIRQSIKTLFIQEIDRRGLTPVLASHNLRELEDICDHVGVLHKGGILFSRDLDELKLGIHKVQCVLSGEEDYSLLTERLCVLRKDSRGSLLTLTVRDTREKIERLMGELHPVFFETLPLSLEEIFISETEVQGYDFKNLLF